MNDYKKLTHTTWESKCHFGWISKYWKKVLGISLKINYPVRGSMRTSHLGSDFER